MYIWNWVFGGSSPYLETTVDGTVWRYPVETADLFFAEPVSLTLVSGITTFSAAYMAFVGIASYEENFQGETIVPGSGFVTPSENSIPMPYYQPFLFGNNLDWFTVVYGMIPAVMNVGDNPPDGMPLPQAGAVVLVQGY